MEISWTPRRLGYNKGEKPSKNIREAFKKRIILWRRVKRGEEGKTETKFLLMKKLWH